MANFPHLILVLGMHRSGTSVLTRALSIFNVDIGSRHLARADNPKGFFEDAHFVEINKQIFAHFGLNWSDPKDIPLDGLLNLAQGELGQAALKFLAEKFANSKIFGLKDPRCSRLLPFWRAVAKQYNCKVSCLLSLRHPLNVAASLKARDNLPESLACALYYIYLRDIIASTQNLPKLVVSYDNLLSQTLIQLKRIAEFLGIFPDQNQLLTFSQSFLDLNLRHHQVMPKDQGSSQALKQAMQVYEVLYNESIK